MALYEPRHPRCDCVELGVAELDTRRGQAHCGCDPKLIKDVERERGSVRRPNRGSSPARRADRPGGEHRALERDRASRRTAVGTGLARDWRQGSGRCPARPRGSARRSGVLLECLDGGGGGEVSFGLDVTREHGRVRGLIVGVCGSGRHLCLSRDRAHPRSVEASLGDQHPERGSHRGGAVGLRRHRSASATPVSRSETAQSFAIAWLIPIRRKIRLRTGGPLVTQSGP